MSIRDKIENHPLLYVIGISISAFCAGIGAYQSVLSIAQLDVLPKSEIAQLRSGQSESQQLTNSIAEKDALVNKLQAEIEGIRSQLEQAGQSKIRLQQNSQTLEGNVRLLQDKLDLAKSNLLGKEKDYNECIQKLNQSAKISQSSGSSLTSVSINRQQSLKKQSGNNLEPFFDSNIIRIDVITFEESGPYYHLLLKHTNKADQPLWLRAVKHQDNTFLHNEEGRQLNYVENYTAGRKNELGLDRGRPVELPPDGSKVLSFSFSREGSSKSNIFSFSSKYIYCIDSKKRCNPRTPFFVTIKGMQIK
jgi:hypothetical protein